MLTRRDGQPTISHSKPWITAPDIAAVDEVMRTGMIADGKTLHALEQHMAVQFGASFATFTMSGRDALALGLAGLRVGKGDEVVIPSYVCHAVRWAVEAVGAKPVLADCGENWCLTAASITPHLTPKTKAIVVVHAFGVAAELDPILALGIPVIEDCAQSLGGRDAQGRLLGTRGAAAIFSFEATKPMTCGQGGMLISCGGMTDPATGAQTITDMQAALGLSQLRRYHEFLERRKQLADFYFDALKGINAELPHGARDRSMFFRFPLRQTVAPFNQIKAQFFRKGVSVRQGVDALLHRAAGLPPKDFPVTEAYYRETLSLPLYPALTDQEAEEVAAAAREILG